jgi:hypothetical protein
MFMDGMLNSGELIWHQNQRRKDKDEIYSKLYKSKKVFDINEKFSRMPYCDSVSVVFFWIIEYILLCIPSKHDLKKILSSLYVFTEIQDEPVLVSTR